MSYDIGNEEAGLDGTGQLTTIDNWKEHELLSALGKVSLKFEPSTFCFECKVDLSTLYHSTGKTIKEALYNFCVYEGIVKPLCVFLVVDNSMNTYLISSSLESAKSLYSEQIIDGADIDPLVKISRIKKQDWHEIAIVNSEDESTMDLHYYIKNNFQGEEEIVCSDWFLEMIDPK